MRLIDANELAKEFDDIGQDIDVLDVLLIIERQKSIDAVPVVRCEKCSHHSDILLKGMEDFVWCNFFNLYRCKDSFCNCGQVE